MGDLHLVLHAQLFDNGGTGKIDDVLIEHGGLPHVLPLSVQLTFGLAGKVEGTI